MNYATKINILTNDAALEAIAVCPDGDGAIIALGNGLVDGRIEILFGDVTRWYPVLSVAVAHKNHLLPSAGELVGKRFPSMPDAMRAVSRYWRPEFV